MFQNQYFTKKIENIGLGAHVCKMKSFTCPEMPVFPKFRLGIAVSIFFRGTLWPGYRLDPSGCRATFCSCFGQKDAEAVSIFRSEAIQNSVRLEAVSKSRKQK